MAYRAEVEIAVRGASELRQLQNRLEATSKTVNTLNIFLEAFAKTADGIPRSVSNLNKQLQDAAKNFNEVALGTTEAKIAAVDYLTATRNLNQGLRERAALLAEVAENERKAKLAAAGIRETTQFSGPIGPGQASATALSSPLPPRSRLRGFTQFDAPIGPGPVSQTALFSRLPPRSDLLSGQSSPVGDLVQRNVKIKQDELALEKALLKLKERKADAVFEELKNSEALVRSANEAKLIAAEARGERPSSQLSILSPEQQLRAESKERAEQIARDAKLKSDANQKVFEAEKKFAQEIAGVESSLAKKIKDQKIDNILEEFQIQERSQNAIFENALEKDKKDGQRFDKELKRREERTKASNKRIQEASRRRTDAVSNALIGGAFPLLFGQGAGASVGGALGGGLGGLAGGQFGFGLSLVGTAVGQAVDTLNKQLNSLAENLKKPSQALTSLEDLGFRVSDSTKKQVDELERAGKVYDAQTLVFEEISERLGTNAVNQLNALNEASNDLEDELGQLKVELLTALLPALVATTSAFAGIVSVLNNLKIPETLVNAGVGNIAKTLVPGINLLPSNVVGQGVSSGLNALFPGTEPDRSDEKLKQEQLESIQENRLDVVKQQIQLVGKENELLNESVFKAKEKVIQDRFTGKVLQANLDLQNKDLKIQEAKLERATALSSLESRRDAQRKRRDREAARGAKAGLSAARRADRRALQEQSQFGSAKISRLRAELTKQNVLQRGAGLVVGRELNIKDTLSNLDKVQELEEQILEAVFEQRKARTDSPRILAEITKEENIQKDILKERIANQRLSLEQQQKSLRLARERASEELKIQLSNRVEDAQFGLRQAEVIAASPFGGQEQQTQLFNLEQERERLELAREQTAQRRRLQQAVDDATESNRASAQEDLKNFNQQSERLTELINQRQAVEQQQLRQNQLLEKYGFIADEVATAVSSSIQAIITGTGSVEEAFSTLFQNIGRAFIDLATQVLAQKAFLAVINALNPGASLFNNSSGGFNVLNTKLGAGGGSVGGIGTLGPNFGIRQFANGGNPPVNRPSIVGERGPELFVPRSSGTIVPNETLDALSRYRPTSSAEAASQTVNVNYSVTEVNGMRYVTEEQFRAGLDQAAKRWRKHGQDHDNIYTKEQPFPAF